MTIRGRTGFATWFTRVFPEERGVSVAWGAGRSVRGRSAGAARGRSAGAAHGPLDFLLLSGMVTGPGIAGCIFRCYLTLSTLNLYAQQVPLANPCIYDIGVAYLMLSVMDAFAKETGSW